VKKEFMVLWTYYCRLEGNFSKSDAQIVEWVRKHQAGESFEDLRGRWNKKHFSSIEEENAYLKVQVEYLKKLNPNLHEEESWIKKSGSESSSNKNQCTP
jgi:transposase